MIVLDDIILKNWDPLPLKNYLNLSPPQCNKV